MFAAKKISPDWIFQMGMNLYKENEISNRSFDASLNASLNALFLKVDQSQIFFHFVSNLIKIVPNHI